MSQLEQTQTNVRKRYVEQNYKTDRNHLRAWCQIGILFH